MSFINIFGGTAIQDAFPQYANLDFTVLGTPVQLAWPTQFQNTVPVVAAYNDMNTAAISLYDLLMPDATLASVGQTARFNNYGAGAVELQDSTGALIVEVEAGEAYLVLLIDNTTAAGGWRTFPSAAGGSAVTQVNATSSSSNLLIGGVPITSSGTITFDLADDLLALTSFGAATGFAVRTAVDTWELRMITGTVNQIVSTNPSGVAGNVTLSLATDITGLNSIEVGNILIATNTISSINLNGNIILDPNGTGVVRSEKDLEMRTTSAILFYNATNTNFLSLQGGNTTGNINLTLPTTAPAIGQVLADITGTGQLGWVTAPSGPGASVLNSIARYANITGSLTDSGVILDNADNISGATSLSTSVIDIGVSANNIISTTTVNTSLIISPNGTGELQSTNPINIQSANGLKFYNAGNTNYTEIRNGTLASNQILILPNTSPLAGQILSYAGGNQLSWAAAPLIVGATTINAIAKYQSVAGALQDSGVLIDGANNITGANSLTAASITVGVAGATTIGTSAGNLNIIPAANLSLNPIGTITIAKTMTFNPGTNELRFVNGGGFNTGFTGSTTAIASQVWELMAADGAANTMIQTNSAGVLSFTTLTSTIASQAIEETATSTTNPVVPANQHFHPSSPKAWVVFDGTTGPATILASYNVTSVARPATGTYTITITNGFSSVNYAVTGSCAYNAGGVNTTQFSSDPPASGTAVTVYVGDHNAPPALVNVDYVCVAMYGDLT